MNAPAASHLTKSATSCGSWPLGPPHRPKAPSLSDHTHHSDASVLPFKKFLKAWVVSEDDNDDKDRRI